MKKLDAIAKQLSRHVKTQADLNTVIGQLTKAMLESALNAEMDSHLGYEKNEKAQTRRKNTRNGYGLKTLKTDQGEIEIQNPRDREATFEPAIVPKGTTRLEGFEKIILALYARGMTTRQIQDTIDLFPEIRTDNKTRFADKRIFNRFNTSGKCKTIQEPIGYR